MSQRTEKTGHQPEICNICAGISRKGPWHSARTKATQIGISNSWLTKMGLICIKDLWVKIHYPAKARLSS